MKIDGSLLLILAFGVFLIWLATPPKKGPKARPRIHPPYETLFKDTSGYYVLDGEPGSRALALPDSFEFITGARDAISKLNPKSYQGTLHVGYWNGDEWEQFFDA